jgi:hypothetical protein
MKEKTEENGQKRRRREKQSRQIIMLNVIQDAWIGLKRITG